MYDKSKIRLYTLQPQDVYEKLKREKVLFANVAFINESIKGSETYAFLDKRIKNAYVWMAEKMDEFEVPHPEGAKTPWWAWYRMDGKEGINFADIEEQGNPGETYKLITIEINPKKVLLSDYDAWHYVLNDVYYNCATNETEWEKAADAFDSIPDFAQEALKRCSWNKIFDISQRENDWFSNGKYVQACFWELNWQDIVDVDDITCRALESMD